MLFDEKWDAASGQWLIENEADIPTLWDGYELFKNKVRRVTQDAQSGIVRLILEWKDPELAAAWANEMVQRLNNQMKARAIEEARITIELLEAELASTSNLDLQQAIYRLIEAQIQTITLARARDDYSFRIIDPAVAPDEDAHVRPKRPVIALGGFVFGLLAGIAAANLLAFWRRPKTA